MPPPLPDGPPVFVCWLNGKAVQVKQGEVLRAVVGDQLLIDGVLGSKWKEILNFKGYAARPWANDGQDMGWEIILDPDSFIDKYRLPSPAPGVARYEVVRETKGARPAHFFVDVEPRRVQSLKLVDAKGTPLTVQWASGGEITLLPGEYAVTDAAGNGPANRLLPVLGNRPLKTGEKFRVEAGRPMLLTLRQATTFAGLGAMTVVPKAALQPSLQPPLQPVDKHPAKPVEKSTVKPAPKGAGKAADKAIEKTIGKPLPAGKRLSANPDHPGQY
jgi:hypothetical protein